MTGFYIEQATPCRDRKTLYRFMLATEVPINEEVKPQYAWEPFEKQKRFLSCPAFEVHYGGAAGGGKSDALLVGALMAIQKKRAKVLLLRRKFVDLERSLIQRSFFMFKGRAKYDGQHKRWRFPNGSTVEFGYCQTLKDLDNYYSAEYTMIGIDQVEQFTEEMYTFFFSRVRTTNPDIQCSVKSTSNPVGVGRGWLAKRFWILGKDAKPSDEAYPVTDEIILPDGTKKVFTYHRAFIPSRVYDNPHIMQNDPMYLARLNQLPTEKRKALMDGRWDAFEGAFFVEFDPKIHICEPFEIPKNWKKSISFDWGYSDPTCVHWTAEDPQTGKLYVYREFYVNRMLDVDVAKAIARHSHIEEINCIYYPWDLDFKNPQTGVSMKERMNNIWEDMGLRYYMKVGNKNRAEGWSAIRYLLSLREDKEPHIKIFSNCKNLIETFPEQIHDETNPEDLDTDGNDHALDSLRYFAATYRNFYEKPGIPVGMDKSRIPIDVGGAIKIGREYRLKKENLQFNWMVE